MDPRSQVEPVIELVEIKRYYRMGDEQIAALDGVGFAVAPGELVAIVGSLGSGKSTLLNILGGLDVPTSGTVKYLEHDLTRFDDTALTRYRREHVGFVFQFHNLIPSLTGAGERGPDYGDLTEPDGPARRAGFGRPERAVVGLYLNPPEKALVLCVDEKSQLIGNCFSEGPRMGASSGGNRSWV